MGQSQSTGNDNDAWNQLPGFHDTQRRRRNKGQPLNNNNNINQRKDAFLINENVKDTIKPIFVGKGNRNPEAPELNATYDLKEVLRSLAKKRETEGEDTGNLASSSDSSSDHESLDEGERGKFHKDIMGRKKSNERLDILKGKSHPIIVKGSPTICQKLLVEDHSDWRSQYSIVSIAWYISESSLSDSRFQDDSAGQGIEFTIPMQALGKRIQVIATRMVEDTTKGKGYQAAAGDVYDPHSRAHERDIRPVLMVEVKSLAEVGPVLIPYDWAFTFTRMLVDNELFRDVSQTVMVLDPVIDGRVPPIEEIDADQLQWLHENTCKATLSVTSSGKLALKLNLDWVHLNLLQRWNTYDWIKKALSGTTIRLKLSDIEITYSLTHGATGTPLLCLNPIKGSRLALCPVELISDPRATANAEEPFMMIFAFINLLQGLNNLSKQETKHQKFPKTSKEWEEVIKNGRVDVTQLLLQTWLEAQTRNYDFKS